MTKTELESKHLAELHALAAEAGVPRYRVLRREELIEKLAGRASAEKPARKAPVGKPRERRESRPRQERKPRERRRRRFGRRRKELHLRDLVLSGGGGRTIVYAETREGCTKLLRELAAELSGESSGVDPIVLLVDPGPEELAEWRREAPQAEIVAAVQLRHAQDAVAQAARRAESGENVIVLIDSLTRLGVLGDVDDVAGLLDAVGSMSVAATLQHP